MVGVGVAVGALYDGNETVYVAAENAVFPPLLLVLVLVGVCDGVAVSVLVGV